MVKETLLKICPKAVGVITFQSPLGEVVKETIYALLNGTYSTLYVSIPSRGSGKGDEIFSTVVGAAILFQSPLGEVVKETSFFSFK